MSTNKSPMLLGKNAVVFGAAGSLGPAVAKEFASEGTRVFLASRTKSDLETVAKQIAASGGEVQTAVVDALDDAGVSQYVHGVAKPAGQRRSESNRSPGRTLSARTGINGLAAQMAYISVYIKDAGNLPCQRPPGSPRTLQSERRFPLTFSGGKRNAI